MDSERHKNVKALSQLTKEEKEKISMEFQRISDLIIEIGKDEYKQLIDGEFENIIKNIDMNLEKISKSEEGFWSKYIVIKKDYIQVKTKDKSICKANFAR